MTDPRFWELHSGLEREAPGSRADTLRALALTGLAGRLRVLDIGAGPGPASRVLLEALPEATVTAVDLHAPFLADAAARVAAAGHGARFRTVVADMRALPFAPASFDLLWSEGAAYAAGVPEALSAWRPLVAPGGRVAFSDAVWLIDRPAARARALWDEYPGMTDLAGLRRRIAAAGYRLLGDFVLSEAAWGGYYGPLGRRLDGLLARHGESPALAEAREEIAVWRAHGEDYGYAFFVVAPDGP